MPVLSHGTILALSIFRTSAQSVPSTWSVLLGSLCLP